MRKPVTLSLRTDLIALADERKGDLSRSRFVERLIEAGLATNGKGLLEATQNGETAAAGHDHEAASGPAESPRAASRYGPRVPRPKGIA